MRVCCAVLFVMGLLSWMGTAEAQRAEPGFPSYLGRGFDYAEFTRFDALGPPKDLIYQSNGYMALRERGFPGQVIIIPAAVGAFPTNTSDRLEALAVAAPVLIDPSHQTYDMDKTLATRGLTYYADRTVYRATFENGAAVTMTVYPIYWSFGGGHSHQARQSQRPDGCFSGDSRHGFPDAERGVLRTLLSFGSPRWPYRLLISASPTAQVTEGNVVWEVRPGGEASVIIASRRQRAGRCGGSRQGQRLSRSDAEGHPPSLERLLGFVPPGRSCSTHRLYDWNLRATENHHAGGTRPQ